MAQGLKPSTRPIKKVKAGIPNRLLLNSPRRGTSIVSLAVLWGCGSGASPSTGGGIPTGGGGPPEPPPGTGGSALSAGLPGRGPPGGGPPGIGESGSGSGFGADVELLLLSLLSSAVKETN